MDSLLVKIFPLFVFFSIGLLLRWVGVARKENGLFLMQFAFYVTIPCVALTTIPQLDVTGGQWRLPVANFLIDVGCLLIAVCYCKLAGVSKLSAGSMVLAAALVNNAFMFPMAAAFFGQQGLAQVVIFDLGNSIALATVVYVTAFKYSGQSFSRVAMLTKVLRTPLLGAVCIGILLSVLGLKLPAILQHSLEPIAMMTGPLVLVGLGIVCSLAIKPLLLGWPAILLRMVGGLGLAWAIALMLGLEGQERAIVLMAGAAPVGFNTITLASLAKLDVELASALASASLLVGFILVPLVAIWAI